MLFARIRRRLAAWNLAVMALVLAVTLGSAAVSELRSHELEVERDLRLGAARAATRLARGEHEHERRGDHHEEEDDDEHAARDLLVFVMLPDGVIHGATALSAPGLPDEAALRAALGGEEREADVAVGRLPVRLLTVPARRDGRVVGAVQVGKPLSADRRELARSLWILALTGAAGLVASLLGSLFLAGRAMAPIRDAFERQRRFLADASHELRTPVAVLRARAESLARAASTADRGELDQLVHDADDLGLLLGEMLDLARLDAGQEAIALEPVAVGDAVDDLVAQLAPLAEARAIALAARTSPVWAMTNLARLRQVLRALVDNALKHTPPGGHVTVEAARAGDAVRVRVSDDGAGIAEADLPRVLGRFYRADAARARASGSGGAGLGLAIADELVRRMKGELTLESALGRGTTVTVTLPLAADNH